MYDIGVGLSFGLRTRLNILFGLEKFQTARRVYYWFISSTMILGFVAGILLFIASPFIAWIMSQDNVEGMVLLTKCIRIYSLVVPIEFANPTNLTVMRSIGKVNITLIFCILCYLPISTLLGVLVTLWLHLDITYLVQSYVLTQWVLACYVYTYLFFFDWEDVEPEEMRVLSEVEVLKEAIKIKKFTWETRDMKIDEDENEDEESIEVMSDDRHDRSETDEDDPDLEGRFHSD